MKKLLLVLLAIGLWAGSSWGQTITIGTGTSTDRYPLCDYYIYSRSQMLFLASELTTGGNISHLRWYRNDIGVNSNAIGSTEIWLMETSSTTLSGTAWEGPGTLVASISNIDLGAGGGWFEVDITDFVYSGSSNLLVSVRTQNAPYTSPHSYWRYTSTSTNYRMRVGGSDYTNPPTMALSYSRPNIQFEIITAPCSGTPVPGNTLSSANPVCSGVNFTLSLQNATPGSGVTYQWQSSLTGADPWTDLGTSSTQITAQTEDTYYRCEVTCDGNTGTSTALQVTMNSFLNCYCASGASSTGDEDITLVQFGSTLNNTSSCASLTGSQGTATGTADLYSNFTSIAATDIPRGTTVPISVEITECASSAYSHSVRVYFDWNQDGLLTGTGEEYIIWAYASSNTHTINADIAVPAGAVLGNTLMRIVCKESSTTGPCLVSSYGETEDYLVNVIVPVDPAISVEPASLAFGTVQSGATSDEFIYSLSGLNLSPSSGDITITPPANYEVSLTTGSGFSASPITKSYTDGTLNATNIYVVFKPTTANSPYSGNILNSGGGAPDENVAVSGVSAATAPFFEGFETGNTDQTAIVGWTQEAVIGTYIWTANTSLTDYNRIPRTGSWNAYLHYSSTRWMFKSFSLTEGVTYNFEMYARQDMATATNSNITVSYGNAGNAASMTNPIVTETGIINGNYQLLEGSLTPSSSGIHYIGIKGYMNSTPYYISIDDISLTEAPTATLNWYNLQSPATANILETANATVYAQCYEDGVTNASNTEPGAGIECWIGYSADNSNPNSWIEWVPAIYNTDVGDNDEFKADLGVAQNLAPGTYYYASRFRFEGGPFTYGGLGGPWESGVHESGILTVQDLSITFANLQFPATAEITQGGSADIYARVYAANVTPDAGASPGMQAWIGWNNTDTDPSTWNPANWTLANFNTQVGNDDEYMAAIGASLTPGTYYYASRFKLLNDAYVYGGYSATKTGGFWDGTNNVSGELTVNPFTINTFPYSESFDGSTFAPLAWGNVKTAGDGDPGTWDRQTTGTNPTCAPHSGAGMARYFSYNYDEGTKGELISPPISFPDDNYQVNFWMYRDDGYTSAADLVNVYYNTTNTSTGGSLLGTVNRRIASSPVVPANGWYFYSFNLPAGSSGSGRYIIFEGVSDFGNNMFLDDVSLVNSTNTWNGLVNTEWNQSGNWDQGIPVSSQNAVIAAASNDPVISTSVNVLGLTINADAVLKVASNGALTVTGTITNNAGNTGLVIESTLDGTGSLINNTSSVQATVQRYLTKYNAIGDQMFHFISSPVAAQAIRTEFVTNTPTAGHDFYAFDELNNMWVNTKDGDGNWNSEFEPNFAVGKGYLVAYPADVTKNFTGTLNSSSPVVLNCTNTVDQGNGWNLLGNPFPSAINWSLVTLGDGMDDALYYYDNEEQNYRYHIILSGDIETTLGSGQQYIPAMQGFMVHAKTSGAQTVSISSAARTHLGQGVFYKSTTSVPGSLSLKVTANGYEDAAYIHFSQNATTAFDGSYDAYKLRSYSDKVPMIFTKGSDDTELAINGLPELESGTVIPVYFNTALNGNFVLTADLTGLNNAHTYLQDLKLNLTQNLSENPVYSFTASPDDQANRFKLTFGSVGIDDPASANGVSIYAWDGQIFLNGVQAGTEVKVTDMTGREVKRSLTTGDGVTILNTVALPRGIYMVSLISGNRVVSSKVVL